MGFDLAPDHPDQRKQTDDEHQPPRVVEDGENIETDQRNKKDVERFSEHDGKQKAGEGYAGKPAKTFSKNEGVNGKQAMTNIGVNPFRSIHSNMALPRGNLR